MANIAEMHEWTERNYDVNGRRIKGAATIKQASYSDKESWAWGYLELLNGPNPKYIASQEKLRRLKQARLQGGRNEIPAWAQNYLDVTGQGAGYE
jgi:hypothetical protein